METTIVYWCYSTGAEEKKMETSIIYWGYSRENGRENGNYYVRV